MHTDPTEPSLITGIKLVQIFCVLTGAVAMILAIGVLLLWLQAESAIRTYLAKGVVLKATVTEKYEKHNSGNRGGGFTTYTIGLRYSYFVKDGRVQADYDFRNKELFNLEKIVTGGQTSGGVMKVANYNLSRHVYYSSWNAVAAGDRIEIVVLPKNPGEKVLLKSFVDRKYPNPVMLRPWFGSLCLIIGITGLTLFKKLGGKF